MIEFIRDCGFAARTLRRSPGFSLAAVLTLAVSLGANASVFAVVNGLLLRPLPVWRPAELVRVGETVDGGGFGPFSYPDFLDLAARARTVRLVAHHPNQVIVTVASEPREEWMELVSANYFGELGVPLPMGRSFLAAEVSSPGLAPVVVVSHAFWRRRLAGDPTVVGREVKVNGRSLTVIGVAAPGFQGTFAGFGVDLWLPLTMQPVALPQAGALMDRQTRFVQLLGRRQAGRSSAAVRSELATLFEQLGPERSADRKIGVTVMTATGIHPFIATLITAFLGLLQGVVVLVLVMACTNLAGLLLARAAERRRDLAIRAAIGASRGRLVRGLLAESALLALAGGALGAFLAVGIVRGLAGLDLPIGIPVSLDFHLDWRVLVFTLAASGVAALVAGLGPAWRYSRPAVLGELRVGGASPDRARTRAVKWLIAAQLATATVLLFSAALLVRSLARSETVNPGFDGAGVLTLQGSPELLGYDEAKARALWTRLVDEAARLPGVERVTLALFVPLGSRGDFLRMAGRDWTTDPVEQAYNVIEPGYLDLLHIPLVTGRDFEATDRAGAPDVAVVTESAARKFFAGAGPLGQTLLVTDRAGNRRRATVVGVTRDIRLSSLGTGSQPLVYLPFRQWFRPDMMLHVRIKGALGPLVRPLSELARAAEPDLAVKIEPFQDQTRFASIPLRIASLVLSFAGAVGLLLALIGVFGVVAYTVTARRRDLGIRLALGANRGRVIWFALSEGLKPAVVGLVIGLPLALVVAALFRNLLVGVGLADPVAVVGVPMLLAAVAGFAAYLPARRAVLVDPLTILREG